ncbi:MAG: acetoin utilization protein AcuC [Gammaproteobacteria bacterium]|nr:acetoin utilization protein AcuC [Gammaproteobacteria bacterium]
MTTKVAVYIGEALAEYHFGATHPFGPKRYAAFVEEFQRRGLDNKVKLFEPVQGTEQQLRLFHTDEYIHRVKTQSHLGQGFLDCGDTPAFAGVYEAALTVVGSSMDAMQRLMAGEVRRAFSPIAGLHHAQRDRAAGFCVFNDCGVVIESLRRDHGLKRIAYVDIDAHHGDGVYYSFEADPELYFVDLHEDGRYLYPGTGDAHQTGRGAAVGSKLNIPMSPGADDAQFYQAWEQAEAFLLEHPVEFILLQCGADSLKGDPITHLQYSPAAHAHATRRLCALADQFGHGRVLAMGGGGYNLSNLAQGWSTVVEALLESLT